MQITTYVLWCFGQNLFSQLRTETSMKNMTEYLVYAGALDFMVSRFHRFNDTSDVAVAAMHAGVDLNSGSVYSKLAASVKAGLVSEPMIDTAITR